MVAANIIPFELPLPLNLPTIEGNVDYRDFRAQLLRIDSLLVQSGLETQMIEADLQRWQARQKRVRAKARQNHQVHARRARRCNIARLLIHENYRGFAARLADSPLLPRSVARMQKVYAPGPQAVAGDRGFDSQLNRFGLKAEGIFNAVCPRAPRQLRQRNRSWKFKRLQRRRAQTEGRIGILKNVFLGGRMRCKGFAHRALTVTWTVLVHNLWVLARLPQPEEAQAEPLAA